MNTIHINESRLLNRMERMAEIGMVNGNGVHRLSLTKEDKEARDLLKTWMLEAGLDLDIDKIGNMYGRRKGETDDAPVAFGSHLDTVGFGGRFDGSLGVIAALEVMETLNDLNLDTNSPLCMVNFTNEEGARFAPDMMGSMVVTAEISIEKAWNATDLKKSDIILKEELERLGYLGNTDPASFRPAAFVELHIEQGPVLEKEQITIGVVESVQGICWTRFVITGEVNHAGTTPMELRKDAGYVVSQIATYCRQLAGEYPGLRTTAGLIELEPNLINVIAGNARIATDIRCPDKHILEKAENALEKFAYECSYGENCEIEISTLTQVDPVKFERRVVASVANSARSLGYTTKRMVSGAGHDAQLMAGVCPAAMIFIPSENGISHSIKEYSSPDDCVAGTNVLLHTVISLSGS